MKKIITEELYIPVDPNYILNGTLSEVCTKVKDLETRLKAEHQTLILDPNKYKDFKIEGGREYYYDDSYEIKIWGIREETEQEYKHRLEKEKIAKEKAVKLAAEKAQKIKEKQKKAKIREKELYLELKKKYDKKGI